MNVECACGAIGKVLPPDAGYERDLRVPLLQWRGGNVGEGRLAVESMTAAVSTCPECEHRSCVYVAREIDVQHDPASEAIR
jgi:hypothetical protein